MFGMFKNSIFGKIFGSLVLTLFLSGAFFIFISLKQQEARITENLIKRSETLSKIASKQIEKAYDTGVWPFETLKLIISESEDIVFLWVTKPDGRIYFSDDPDVISMGKMIKEPFLGTEETLIQDWTYPMGVEEIKLIIQPLEIRDEEGRPWSLLMGVSLRSVVSAERAVILSSVVLFIITFFLAIIISFFLTKRITSPLERLREGTTIIGKGNLDYRIEIKTGDELEKLAGAFNKMTEDMANILNNFDEARKTADEEKNKTLAIITSFTDGLLVFDKEMFEKGNKLILMNPQAENILEINSKELIGKSFDEMFPFPLIKPLIDLVKKGPQKIIRRELAVKEILTVEVSVMPLTKRGRKIGFFIVLHDISREKEIEKIKSEFVSTAAHQLRTPLSAVKWTLRMLIDGDLGLMNPEQRTFLMQGYQSNERMIHLVNDLLDVARIEEGRTAYEFTLVNFEDLIDGVISETSQLSNKKKIHFVYEKLENRIPEIKADVQKIRLVVQNLIDNAIKYTPSGGQVTIFLKNDNMKVEFKIKDSGIGIPASDISKLFTKFYRSKNAIRAQTEGSGLGLFIVKNIIEKHGGRVWVESEEGKGSTFSFFLPVEP